MNPAMKIAMMAGIVSAAGSADAVELEAVKFSTQSGLFPPTQSNEGDAITVYDSLDKGLLTEGYGLVDYITTPLAEAGISRKFIPFVPGPECEEGCPPLTLFNGAVSQASLTYQFSVEGPEDREVEVNFKALSKVDATTGGFAGVRATWQVLDGSSALVTGGTSFCSDTGANCSVGRYSVFDNVNVTLSTNRAYSLGLFSYAFGVLYNGGPFGDRVEAVSAYAYVDPYISLVGNAPGYSLRLSDGVGNAPLEAVPEPSTWLSMILGFALVGASCRKAMSRRRNMLRR